MESFGGKISIASIFQQWWLPFLAWMHRSGQVVRPCVRVHVQRSLACRTPRLGYHLYHCKKCKLLRVVPHSCKSPFCSSCGTARARAWSEQLLSDLLPVRYHHVVFTIPYQFRPFIQDNRQRLLPALFQAASEAVFALTSGASQPLSRMGRKRVHASRKLHVPGFQLALHSFGSRLNWNPHLHMLVTAGGLSLDGLRWVETPRRSWLNADMLAVEWRKRLVRLIEAEHQAHPLFCRKLKVDARRKVDVAALLGFAGAMKWYVNIGKPLEDPKKAMGYCTRYSRRPALGEARILNYDGKNVTFLYKDYHEGGKSKPLTISAFKFIHRLIQHIPDKQARHFRSYGLFAPRCKTNRLAQARTILKQRKPRRPRTLTWESRRKACGEKKPLACPSCSKPMKLHGVVFGSPRLLARKLGIDVDQKIPHPLYISLRRFKNCS